jgi:hypothetical protein
MTAYEILSSLQRRIQKIIEEAKESLVPLDLVLIVTYKISIQHELPWISILLISVSIF